MPTFHGNCSNPPPKGKAVFYGSVFAMIKKKCPFLSSLELSRSLREIPDSCLLSLLYLLGSRYSLNTAPSVESDILSRLRTMMVVPDIQLLLQGQIISVLKSEKHCDQCYLDYVPFHQRGVEGKMGKKMGGKSGMSGAGRENDLLW